MFSVCVCIDMNQFSVKKYNVYCINIFVYIIYIFISENAIWHVLN